MLVYAQKEVSLSEKMGMEDCICQFMPKNKLACVKLCNILFVKYRKLFFYYVKYSIMSVNKTYEGEDYEKK